jgi:hypothetical protein
MGRQMGVPRPLSRAAAALGAGAVTILSWSSPALATAPGNSDSTYINYDPPATVRRGGFALGLSMGFGVASVNGFPNKVESLSDPNAEVFTGAAVANSLSLWVGGALRDWFTFGIGARSTAGFASDNFASLPALLFHVEGFPLFFKGGHYQNLGLALDGGLGTGVIFGMDAKPGSDPLASGGSMSFVGLTAFYEPLRFWHFSAGPGLSYTHSFSQSLQSHDVLLSFRMTFYGNQPKLPKARKQERSRVANASPRTGF